MVLSSQLAHNILHDVNAASALLLTVGAVLLLCKPGCGRAQRSLALLASLLALPFVAGILAAALGYHIAYLGGILNAPTLVGGTFYLILLLMLPLDLVRPGWFTSRRVALIMAPYVLVGCSYYIILWGEGCAVAEIDSYEELWSRRGEFGVWFRAVLLLMLAVYVWLGFRAVTDWLPAYVAMCGDDLGGGAEAGVRWLRGYMLWFLPVLGSYALVVFTGDVWLRVIHIALLLTFLIYLFFRSWHYVNPTFEYHMNYELPTNESAAADDAGIEPEVAASCGFDEETACGATADLAYDQQFTDKIPEYTRQVREWFERERPYLNSDFKLLDVMGVLPLNRTYLSRVFNEGFGANFSAVVRNYRLEYAEVLLLGSPLLSIVEVARRSGFSSSSVFHRAFVARKGVTPVQFRRTVGQ